MSQLVDKKLSVQVRIDAGLHQLLKEKSKRTGKSIKALVEEGLSEVLAITPKGKRRRYED